MTKRQIKEANHAFAEQDVLARKAAVSVNPAPFPVDAVSHAPTLSRK